MRTSLELLVELNGGARLLEEVEGESLDVAELVSVDRELVLRLVVPPACRRTRISGGIVAVIASFITSNGMLRAFVPVIVSSEILEI